MLIYILIAIIVSIPMVISIYKVVLKNSAINGANVKIELINEARMYIDNKDTYLTNYKNHKDYALLESALGELIIAYNRYLQSILGTAPITKTSSIDPYVAAGIGTSFGGIVGGIAMGVAAQREQNRVNAELSRFRQDYGRIKSAEGQVKYLVKIIRSIVVGSSGSKNESEESERLAGREEKRQRTAKILKPIVCGMIAVSVLLLAFIIYRFIFAEKISLSKDYKEANIYRNQGEYDKAIEIYEKLEIADYKDASKKKMETKYDKAQSAYSNQEYDKAFELFRDIEDYSDSKGMLNACCYGRGKEEFNRENFHDAKLYFMKSNGYLDSDELIKESTYQEALEYLEVDNMDKALECFDDLVDYKDSKDRISKIYYSMGEDAFENAKYEDAISYFEASGDNVESNKMIKKSEQYIEYDKSLQKAVMFACCTPSAEKVESYIEGIPEEFIVDNKEAKNFVDAWRTLNKDVIFFCGTWEGYEEKHPERSTREYISLKYEDGVFYCSDDIHEWVLNENQPNNNELCVSDSEYEKYVLSPDKKTMKYYLADHLVSVYKK